jgi:hypothetical protein
MKKFIFLLFCCKIIQSSIGKIVLLPDDKIEICSEEKSGHFSYDDLHIEIESDTDIFLNGSVKFLKEVKSPWNLKAYAEQSVRDKWIVAMFNRKIPDYCAAMKQHGEFWYDMLKDKQGCPILEGVNYDLEKNLLN